MKFSAPPEPVRLFQIHQHEDYSITVRVPEGEGSDAREHIDIAVDALHSRVGDQVTVRLKLVDSLHCTGGKTTCILSDVARN
ncbi:hypothetical protein ACH0CV_09190 [Brachybacterium paraconglomeratum]|uniref:hypothetical protein n=1 Tax=Brachybacterium paraconglomeratum TaxID=173362 RepID=UPI0038798152